MIYIFEGGSVIYDGSTISEQEKAQAIVVCERPKENIPKGYYSVLKWDVETQTAWYEYEPILPTKDDKIAELEKQVNALNIAMAEMMGV